MCTRMRFVLPAPAWYLVLPSERQPRAQRAAKACARRPRGSSRRIVIVPRPPPPALAGQLTATRTSPREGTVSVRAKMTTLAGDEGPPAAPAAWLAPGAGDPHALPITAAAAPP